MLEPYKAWRKRAVRRSNMLVLSGLGLFSACTTLMVICLAQGRLPIATFNLVILVLNVGSARNISKTSENIDEMDALPRKTEET